MPLKWKIDNEPDYLVVVAEGEWHIPSVLKMIDAIGGECRALGHDRILCDLRGVHGHWSQVDRYLAGSRVGDRLTGMRIAVLMNEKAVVTGSGINVAARRGAMMMGTVDIDEARRWLFALPVRP